MLYLSLTAFSPHLVEVIQVAPLPVPSTPNILSNYMREANTLPKEWPFSLQEVLFSASVYCLTVRWWKQLNSAGNPSISLIFEFKLDIILQPLQTEHFFIECLHFAFIKQAGMQLYLSFRSCPKPTTSPSCHKLPFIHINILAYRKN